MRNLLTILILAFSNMCFANFGGYYRYSTEGGGTILNSSNSQLIELVKEDITILLDQRVNFRAVFYLKNTSSEEQELTLAFPQFSYWDVPYKSGSGYSPENYYPLNEKLLINGNQISFDEELYSDKFKSYENIKLENKSTFSGKLVEYAGMHEAETPPSMPFVIWKLKKVKFAPDETIAIDISFKRSWFFKDESWSIGQRTTGERNFQYIFETANTWKNSKIGQFNMSIKFPSDAWDNLNLDNPWFQRISENEVTVKKTNWSPESSENLDLTWKSDFQLSNVKGCFEALYYDDYSWRYGFDGSKTTSWCITSSLVNCGSFELSPIDSLTKKSASGRIETNRNPKQQIVTQLKIINGFAKSEKLASQNAKPKTIVLVYIDTSGNTNEQIIKLTNNIAIQTFELTEPAIITKGIQLKITDYYPGTKYQDVCLAEMWLK
jgi:hypothetical protein